MHEFSRQGYVPPMLAIPEGKNVTITLPKTSINAALWVTIGPKSSLMVFQMNDNQQILKCFNQHTYYERGGGCRFQRVSVDKFIAAQAAKPSESALLNGLKDIGPRCGGITHLLYDE